MQQRNRLRDIFSKTITARWQKHTHTHVCNVRAFTFQDKFITASMCVCVCKCENVLSSEPNACPLHAHNVPAFIQRVSTPDFAQPTSGVGASTDNAHLIYRARCRCCRRRCRCRRCHRCRRTSCATDLRGPTRIAHTHTLVAFCTSSNRRRRSRAVRADRCRVCAH